MAVISDKGYVCSVQLLQGLDKATDRKAIQAVRQWHLNAAQKDGRPVPVVVDIRVDFWRNANGELVQSAPNPVEK